jgi:hypothetical protein
LPVKLLSEQYFCSLAYVSTHLCAGFIGSQDFCFLQLNYWLFSLFLAARVRLCTGVRSSSAQPDFCRSPVQLGERADFLVCWLTRLGFLTGARTTGASVPARFCCFQCRVSSYAPRCSSQMNRSCRSPARDLFAIVRNCCFSCRFGVRPESLIAFLVLHLRSDFSCRPHLTACCDFSSAARAVLCSLCWHSVISRFEIAKMRYSYVCLGCFIHTYSNNMINRFHIR